MSHPDRPTIHLMPGHAKRLRLGHPWAYSNELRMDDEAKALAPGTVVRVVDPGREVLGCATFNPHSLIALRMLARQSDTDIDAGFFRDRLSAARDLRDRLVKAPHYRLIHAEADNLPGLAIDRFGDVFVCQVNSAGMERLIPDLLAALHELFDPRAVVLRGDSPVREFEGLDSRIEVIAGALEGTVETEEYGVRFIADPLAGQKTGWFIDQRENRHFVAGLANGATMLDVYSYAGGFGIAAAMAGATQVTCLDRSESALASAARAADLNGVAARCSFERGEAFAEMEHRAKAGERYDVVVADPPSFVKNRKGIKAGLRGYRKMTRLAAALVAPGGFLFVASCSHNAEVPAFAEAVSRGIADADRSGRILRAAGAAPDHPNHPALPESNYLKSLTLQLD
ncbi:MAG: class I SAM-dependent rRNA methyltransferase [Alphaproteobacteria bacterium]